MKNNLFIITLLTVLVSCKTKTNSTTLKNQAVVQDYANFFSKEQKGSLTSKIINYEASSSNEICVYTLDSIPNTSSAHLYATLLANRLGVGKKEKNNGVLVLISKYDREIAIATGLETEKFLTDYKCKIIIDSTIVPKFKKNEFYKGMNNAIDSIITMWK